MSGLERQIQLKMIFLLNPIFRLGSFKVLFLF